MKKLAFLLAILLVFPICFSLASCNKEEILTLNVYNWEEYIGDGVIEGFEQEYYATHGQKVKVNYSTFGTCENMYNELKLTQNKKSKTFKYDLVCPSDYMIQRMIEEDMCETLDWIGVDGQPLTNYQTYTSNYIKTLFNNDLDSANKTYTYKLGSYSACYMWGTMGYVYNPEKVSDDDMKTWEGILNPAYKNTFTIKDSPRDSYILAMGIAKERGLLDAYNTTNYTDLFNIVDDFTIKTTADILKEVKQNLYGFEVDSGKNDMASGKLLINFAWSGDGVYILDVAEESGTYLSYSVPETGSNIFFDGWVMPKGANKALAQEFLDYLFQPEIAMDNMDYIGYTPSTAGADMHQNAIDWYGTYVLQELTADFLAFYGEVTQDDVITLEGKDYIEVYVGEIIDFLTTDSNGDYELIYPIYDEEENVIGKEDPETVTLYKNDISYFFRTDDADTTEYVVYTDEVNRQFTAQYPSKEVVDICGMMRHLTTTQLEDLNEMWSGVKIGYMKPIYMVLIVLLFIVLFALAVVFFKLIESGKFGYGKVRKNLTLVSKEEIKN